MSTWPSDAKIVLAGYGDEPMPSIRRTEMERGMAKQAVLNTHISKELTFAVQFETAQAAQNFEDWWLYELKQIGFFWLRDPRRRVLVEARFKDAKIGQLNPVVGGFGLTQRTVTVEYLQ